jgi:hypothetical protein
MRERDAWVQEHYDGLGARHCLVIEENQLVKPDEILER